MDVKYNLHNKDKFVFSDLPFFLRDRVLLNKAVKAGYVVKQKKAGNALVYKLSKTKLK